MRFLLYANEWDVEGIIANLPSARDRENRNPERTGLAIVRRLVRGRPGPRTPIHQRPQSKIENPNLQTLLVLQLSQQLQRRRVVAGGVQLIADLLFLPPSPALTEELQELFEVARPIGVVLMWPC